MNMTRIFAGLAAAALVGAAVPAVASAHCDNDGGGGAIAGAIIGGAIGNSATHYRHNRGANTAVGAIAGAALGAAITRDCDYDGGRYYRDGYYSGDRYYGRSYGRVYVQPRTYYYYEPRRHYREYRRDRWDGHHGGHHRGRW